MDGLFTLIHFRLRTAVLPPERMKLVARKSGLRFQAYALALSRFENSFPSLQSTRHGSPAGAATLGSSAYDWHA